MTSLNSDHCEVYLIQYYVISLSVTWWFSPGTPVSSTNKTDRHDITEILLKVALNTITLTSHHDDNKFDTIITSNFDYIYPYETALHLHEQVSCGFISYRNVPFMEEITVNTDLHMNEMIF